MKEQILDTLRTENTVVSGAVLSDQLQISRVSVWKHINKLKELGYRIEATTRGYRLLETPDVPYPWEFPGRASSIHYFDEVTSTMDIARDLARKDGSHFTVVVAGRQLSGRGRLQRAWLSPEGGLYFTMILRPSIPLVLSCRINYAASAVLADTVRRMYGIDAGVKWPNDILVGDKKIAGLLSEMEAESDRITYLNVGIGINVNNDPPGSVPGASSLLKIIGKTVSRKALLAEFLNRFEERITRRSLHGAIDEWKACNVTLNRRVEIVTPHEVARGLAVDVHQDGALVLALDDGTLKRVMYGDCFH